jgi:hypothetical protein
VHAAGTIIRERVRLAVLYLVGLVTLAALESLAYYLISGDFLYRSHAISKIHNATIVEQPNLIAFLHAIYWNLRLVTAFEVASTQILFASSIVFIAALATRSRLAYFSATGLFVGGYLIFGSSSFTRFMPLPVKDRYFEPLVAFLAVSAAALLFRFRNSGPWPMRRAIAAVGLVVLTAIPSVTANASDVAFPGVGRNAGVALRALHVARPDTPIVVSPMLYRMLEPFVSPELFASLEVMKGDQLHMGFYVAHPWEAVTPAVPLLLAMKSLPVYLVIDEDQRYLGRYSSEPRHSTVASRCASKRSDRRANLSAAIDRRSGVDHSFHFPLALSLFISAGNGAPSAYARLAASSDLSYTPTS